MFLDVAMPEIAAGIAGKRNVDARDHVGRALHHILPTTLIRVGWECFSGEAKRGVLQQVEVAVKLAAIDHLEANVMEMDGMGILGQIDQ